MFRLLILALISLSPLSSFALESINLMGGVSEYFIENNTEYLEDPTSTLSFENVQNSQGFIHTSNKGLNFGYSDSTYWIRFKVLNNSKQDRWLLEISYPPLDYLDYYMPVRNSYKHYESGDMRPASNKSINNNNHVFLLNASNRLNYHYLKVNTESSMAIPIKIISNQSFIDTISLANYFQGAFLGIVLVMVFYNFFLFVTVKDKSYLYYVFFIGFSGILQISMHGYSYQFFWPNYPRWSSDSTLLFGNFAPLFGILFAQRFLLVKQYLPKLDKVLSLTAIFYMVNGVGVFFYSYKLCAYMMVFIGLIIYPLLLIIGVITHQKGCRQSRYYLLATSAVLAAAFILNIKTAGFLTSNFFTENVLQMAVSFEAILLSLGLADRINTLKKETLEASESSNKLKSEFISTITHELLTPINGVNLSLSLLKEKINDDEGRDFLKTANDSSAHLLSLIETMITFTEARKGTIKLKESPVDIRRLLKGITDYFTAIKMNNDLTLKLNIDERIPKGLLLDNKRLSLVIVQLMKNAASFTKSGEVCLSAELSESNKNIRIAVSDTGAGISVDKLNSIFSAFSQIDNSINREHGGLGIGLTISKDILELMNTKLDIESTVNEGTIVSFTIPAIAVELEKRNIILPRELNHATGSKILVVEDNPVNTKLLCKVLEKAGYIPISAIHGEEALSCLDDDKEIKAILMDCQMPVMDGFETTRRIREHEFYSDIPIIAVTANVSDEDQQKCINCGMSDYMTKPVTKFLIEQALSKWLTVPVSEANE